MTRHACLRIGAVCAVVVLARGNIYAADAARERALLDRYCVTCHNARQKTAGLVLEKDAIDLQHVSERADLWEKVVRKLRAGAMPPANAPRPDKASYDEFASWLEQQLDSAAATAPN